MTKKKKPKFIRIPDPDTVTPARLEPDIVFDWRPCDLSKKKQSRARVALKLEDVEQCLKDVSENAGYRAVFPAKAQRQARTQAGRLTQIETELVELSERLGALVTAVQEINKRTCTILERKYQTAESMLGRTLENLISEVVQQMFEQHQRLAREAGFGRPGESEAEEE